MDISTHSRNLAISIFFQQLRHFEHNLWGSNLNQLRNSMCFAEKCLYIHVINDQNLFKFTSYSPIYERLSYRRAACIQLLNGI